MWVLTVGNETQNEARAYLDNININSNYLILKSDPINTNFPDSHWSVTVDKVGSIDEEKDYLADLCANFTANDCFFFSLKLNYYMPVEDESLLKKYIKTFILSWVPEALQLANKKRHHTDVGGNVYYIYKIRNHEEIKNCEVACVSSKEHLANIINDSIKELGGHTFLQVSREYDGNYFFI